jgi:hypothetical protein
MGVVPDAVDVWCCQAWVIARITRAEKASLAQRAMGRHRKRCKGVRFCMQGRPWSDHALPLRTYQPLSPQSPLHRCYFARSQPPSCSAVTALSSFFDQHLDLVWPTSPVPRWAQLDTPIRPLRSGVLHAHPA